MIETDIDCVELAASRAALACLRSFTKSTALTVRSLAPDFDVYTRLLVGVYRRCGETLVELANRMEREGAANEEPKTS